MSLVYIYEKKFMYLDTFDFESEDVEKIIREKLAPFTEEKYDIFINCVKNKNMEKLGYSYGWISDERLFNILIGLNPDGTERIERKLVEKEIVEKEIVEKDTDVWADMSDDQEYEETFLGPLINFEQLITVQEAHIIQDYKKQNILFTENNLAEKDLKKITQFFTKFNNDKFQNKYPAINVKKKKNKTFCTIKFSPRHPHTASFVLNLVKKINFNDNLYFFSQTKNKDYEK